jgi:hypothetical protein
MMAAAIALLALAVSFGIVDVRHLTGGGRTMTSAAFLTEAILDCIVYRACGLCTFLNATISGCRVI